VNFRSFFAELKRRNVYKVAIAYGVVAWLLMQIASQIFPFFEIPNWAVRLVVLLLVIGFPVAVILAWAFELTPEGVKRTEVADAAQEYSRGALWIYIVVIGAALSVGLFVLGRYTVQRTTSHVIPQSISEKSLAVLPFANLSGNPENAYFAAGIQDEIITRLAKIGQLKVISCLSTERFKTSPDDVPAIAKQLGVANVLQGSVQRSADQVRVNVQLVEADDTHLWADTFDRKLTDVFQIESDIAKTIAEKLETKLTGSEEQAISAKPTVDLEAHQLYLKGRYLWNRRTAENLKKALNYFQQAVDKDPDYALAYTGIADTCALFSVYGAGAPQEYLPRAKAAAEKALALDDSLAEAHASMGLVFYSYFEGAQSVKEFKRAVELNPNYATAHHWYGRLTLVMLGQLDHAMAEVKRAYELDPVSSIIHSDLGGVNYMARRYDEAIKQLRSTVEIDPEFYFAHRYLGMALELKGDTGRAIAEYKKALELNDDPSGLAFIAHAEASMGHQNEARALLAQLTDAATKRYAQPYAFALVHLALGEREQALDWLERAVEERGATYFNFIKVDPFFDPLRGDPRFEAVVQKVAGEKP
jgi:TolB-like protein/Flp pilus assembly protein TadD